MRRKLFIDGDWVTTDEHVKVYSPYNKTMIAEFSLATADDVEKAVQAAYDASKRMRELTAFERSNILEQLSQLFKENREKAAEIISLESAKPLKYALAEIDRTVETYKFAAEEAKRISGEMIPMDASQGGKGRFAYTLREPLGVIAAITPFNFPQNLVAHKVGPAIASGNTIVLKPATQTALSALFLAELLAQTDLPKGAFNLVTGAGKVIGDAFIENEHVKMITFTGSPSVGISLRNRAGMKKVTLELGSNAGLIIDDNVNLDEHINRIVMGAFSNQGQVCISLQRIYVKNSILEEFLEKFKLSTEKLIVGNPLELSTDLSSMISEKEQKRAYLWVDEAVKNGAELISGGHIEDDVFRPTILSNVSSQERVSCEEVFAPVVSVNGIATIDDGITAINDSEYGLQAGIFTSSIQTAFKVSKELQVGGVLINDVPTFRVDHMPYGGVKKSGTGREGIKYTVEEMTEMKLVIWNNT